MNDDNFVTKAKFSKKIPAKQIALDYPESSLDVIKKSLSEIRVRDRTVNSITEQMSLLEPFLMLTKELTLEMVLKDSFVQ